MKNRRNLYQEVTNRIIEKLEQGVAPWRCTWSKYGMARNVVTGREYNGINRLLLNLTPNPIPYFMTFNQVKERGGKVKKGAKANQVFYYNTFYKDENNKTLSEDEANLFESQGKAVKTKSFLKYYNVFNVDDIDDIGFFFPKTELKENERIEKCDNIINGMSNAPKLLCENADRAYYDFERDIINMPDIMQFDRSEEYYSTYFHELVHSTGHKSRLAREGITTESNFGKMEYSKEELIAEMGASFLCALTDIDFSDVTENSASYIKGWLKVLREDNKFIFNSAAKAQKAVDYILKES